ncbi:hypothetical protein GGR54DRAFT_625860, partial [Hypoxylon sp. NC1633]
MILRNRCREDYSTLEWRKRASPLTLRGIGANLHTTDDYVILPFVFQRTDKQNNSAAALSHREASIVEDLQAHMLVGTGILVPEQFDILLSRKFAAIESCGV